MSANGSHLMTALPRRGTPVNGVLLIFAYMVALVTPLVVAGIVRPKTDHTILWELGKSFALVAIVILVLQFVLSARLRRLCRHYGLDMVLRFHSGMAVFAVVLLVLHPFLFVIAGAGWDLLLSLRVPWYIWVGKIGSKQRTLHAPTKHMGNSRFAYWNTQSIVMATRRWELIEGRVNDHAP